MAPWLCRQCQPALRTCSVQWNAQQGSWWGRRSTRWAGWAPLSPGLLCLSPWAWGPVSSLVPLAAKGPVCVSGPPGQNVTMDEGGSPLLPDSLVYQVFLSLGPADVLAAGLVCRQWQAVSRDEFLWREQFYRYFQVARDVPRHPGQHRPSAGWGRPGWPPSTGPGSGARGWAGRPPAARALA